MFRSLLRSSSGIHLNAKITQSEWQYFARQLTVFVHIICVVTYAKYYYSDCVTFTFKRFPDGDPNKDRNMLEKMLEY
jgi:hypothetical protein